MPNDVDNKTPGQGETQAPESTGGTKLFTQEELNRIVQERLARERAKYADYDKLKEQLEELQKVLQDKDKTIEEKEAALAEFQEKQAALEEEAATLKLRQQILSAATQLGFRYPTDAEKLLDWSQLTAEPEKVEEAVKKLAKERPDLLGTTVPPTGTTAPRRGTGTAGETEEERLARLGLRPGPINIWKSGPGGGVVFPAFELGEEE